ncbi:MAG: prephenate dehydrogenase/arogenate dehydrogenase family protein [Dehalococcoidia bacterium]|nr:prephenate dehydrogenase/arogenate dehydrogenase family protein [Dehalococcoidia bacterium]
MGKLAIIGLGLIGSSMGLALRRAEPVNTEIVGFDKDADIGAVAFQMGAVQRLAPTLRDAVADATMIIVATPIISIRGVFEKIAPHLQKGAVVTDTASTKADVMRWARDTLPPGVHFVGGHPMAGKEQAGPGAAEPSLFDGRPYCIVSSGDVMPGAVSAVENLAKAVEAEPFFLDAEEHDSYAAAISHVPLIASIGLFNLARSSIAWRELANMAGPGFRDLTRLASGEPGMAHDICLTNRENILHWINRYIGELQRLADQVEQGEPQALYRILAETQMERDNFLVSPPKREPEGKDVDLPNAGEAFMDSMIGGYWRNRATEMTSALEERAKARSREERLRRRD